MHYHETALKFECQTTLVREYEHWLVLFRPRQITIGSLVLSIKDDIRSFSSVSSDAFAELALVTCHIEEALRTLFQYDKINYISLMMIDPQVHFHVIPRYESSREVLGVSFEDVSWPKQPEVAFALSLSEAQSEAVLAEIRGVWPNANYLHSSESNSGRRE